MVIYTHITFINNMIPCCTRHPRSLRPLGEVESCGMLVWRPGLWRPAFFTLEQEQEDVMKYSGSVNFILTRLHLTVLNYNKLWCTNVSSANKFRYISSSPRPAQHRSLNSNPHWEENFDFHVILLVTCKYSYLVIFSVQYVSYVMQHFWKSPQYALTVLTSSLVNGVPAMAMVTNTLGSGSLLVTISKDLPRFVWHAWHWKRDVSLA